MSVDPFMDALLHIKNSDFVAKRECRIMPATKLLEAVLNILKSEKYVDDYSRVKEKNKSAIVVKLNGNITDCKAIKPRFSVNTLEFEKFEKRFLPAKNAGILVLSTPQGLMTHIDAKKKNIGGRLIAYVY